MYGVTWRRVDNRTLEFTCKLACRTPVIVGCSVNLINRDNNQIKSNYSTVLSGTDEAIGSRNVIILVNGINSTAGYNYVAAPHARINGTLIPLNDNDIEGLILPAEVNGM